MRSTVIAAAVLCLAGSAMANQEFLDAFVAKYKIKDTSAIGTSACAACHVSNEDFKRNPYGKDLEVAGKTPSDEGFTAVESKDSDYDGTPNLKEIEADTLPGDEKSGGDPTAEKVEKPKEETSIIPKNGFHPAIVHFPIALFIGGLLLDALGIWKKNKTLLHAGWYNIIMGAVTTLGGIASGILAMIMMKMPLVGTVLEHVILALISTACMWVMVFMRVHKHEKMQVGARVIYYILAIAAFVLISWAGHVGGVLVYGE